MGCTTSFKGHSDLASQYFCPPYLMSAVTLRMSSMITTFNSVLESSVRTSSKSPSWQVVDLDWNLGLLGLLTTVLGLWPPTPFCHVLYHTGSRWTAVTYKQMKKEGDFPLNFHCNVPGHLRGMEQVSYSQSYRNGLCPNIKPLSYRWWIEAAPTGS